MAISGPLPSRAVFPWGGIVAGSSMVNNPPANGFDPWSGNKITHAADKDPAAAAAAAAKSLQLCPTLCDPIDGSPPGPAVPGIL